MAFAVFTVSPNKLADSSEHEFLVHRLTALSSSKINTTIPTDGTPLFLLEGIPRHDQTAGYNGGSDTSGRDYLA
jgi:hypothetical protein